MSRSRVSMDTTLHTSRYKRKRADRPLGERIPPYCARWFGRWKVTMYAIPLGEDGAELRPLEPWQAEEFLAHMDRGREFIGRRIGLADAAADLASARAF